MRERITFYEAIWLVLFLVLFLDYSLTMLIIVVAIFPRWMNLIDNIRTNSLYRRSGMKKEAQDLEREIEEELKAK